MIWTDVSVLQEREGKEKPEMIHHNTEKTANGNKYIFFSLLELLLGLEVEFAQWSF